MREVRGRFGVGGRFFYPNCGWSVVMIDQSYWYIIIISKLVEVPHYPLGRRIT